MLKHVELDPTPCLPANPAMQARQEDTNEAEA